MTEPAKSYNCPVPHTADRLATWLAAGPRRGPMPADITAEPEVAATLNSFAQNFTELEAAYRRATAVHAAAVHDLNDLREETKSLRTENVARRHEVTVLANQLGEALSRENDCRQTIGELRRRLRRPARATGDVAGQDLRPDPGQAQTPAELVTALKEYRIWAGNPSYREMAQRSGRRAGASTMCEAFSADKLPSRLSIVEAIVAGCGGGEDDLRRFASAWRRLAMKDRATATVQLADPPGPARQPIRPRPLSAAS